MSWLDLGILVGALVVASLAVHLVHKYWSHEERRKHTDVADPMDAEMFRARFEPKDERLKLAG